MIKVICWNIGKAQKPLEELLLMDADLALLQEVHPGGYEWLKTAKEGVAVSPQAPWEPWPYEHYDRWPLVVKLSNRVSVEWFKQVLPSVPWEGDDEIAVSNDGILAAAKVIPIGDDEEPFIAVSMYARWFRPHPAVGSRFIYSDAAAHHIISGLTTFIGPTHRVLAAGDLNNIYGATEDNRLVWYERDRTVFDRMAALGLEFVGPQAPDGRQALPTPQGLPASTRNVATFHTSGNSPATAENQLDYVFASRGFHESVRTQALNGVDEWGSSDHCRVLIRIEN